jgi:hypothetical protein
VIGDWGKGWEIQVQPVAVQSKPKGCRMQEGDAGTKSLYIPPIRPLSGSAGTSYQSLVFVATKHEFVTEITKITE